MTNKIINLFDSENNCNRLSVDEVIARKLNLYQNWTCGAGVKNIYIDYDGNVWKCNSASSMRVDSRNQRILYTSDNLKKYAGYLGSIHSDFSIPTSWDTCPWQSCPCGADVLIPKAQPGYIDSLVSNGPNDDNNRHNDRPSSNRFDKPVAVEPYFLVGKQLLWDIGRRCNFSCSYCWPGSHSNSEGFLDWTTIHATVNKVLNNWSNGTQTRWYFGGGEPTVHPKFIDWMKLLKDHNQWTLVTSNGSRPSKYWKELVPYLNGVNLSVHFEFINEDKLIDNIQVIADHYGKNEGWLEIKLMATPDSLERAVALKSYIAENNLLISNDKIVGSLSLVPIRDLVVASKLVDYTPEQQRLLETQV